MSGPACIVLVDPSTGLSTYADACREAELTLVVVSTEHTRRHPDYFQRPEEGQRCVGVDCDEVELPRVLARLQAQYDVRSVVAGDEAAVEACERANRSRTRSQTNDPATVLRRVSKYAMHEALSRAGLPTPQQHRFDLHSARIETLVQMTAQWRFPLVIKPVVCAGSVCTYRIERPRDLAAAVQRARAEIATHSMSDVSSAFLLQQFVHGPELLVNTVSHAGRHHVTGVYNYTKFTNFDVPVYQSVNDDGMGPREAAVVDYVQTVLDTLGVVEGPVNTDLIVSPDGPRLLEVNARIVGFGGSLSRLETIVRGRNQATCIAALAAKRPLPEPLAGGASRVGKVVLLQSRFDRPMAPPNDAALRRLSSWQDHVWWKSPGQPLRASRSYLHDTIGYVLLAHADRARLERDYHELVELQDGGVLF